VALIPQQPFRRAAAADQVAGFSPRAGIRGFDTRDVADPRVGSDRGASRFSPRAGIRGFDTFLLTFFAVLDGGFQSPSGDSWL
jgi:hypothetical protein